MEEKFLISSSAGYPISALIHRDKSVMPQKLIIIVGGYGTPKESPNQQDRASFFEEQGYATLRFDRYGVGETGGDFLDTHPTRNLVDMDDIRKYVLAQKWFKKDEIILFGNSYGGLLSFMEAALHPVYQKIILSAPALAYQKTLNGTDMDQWRKQKVMHLMGIDRHINFYDDMMTYDLDKMATQIKCPVLIVHGTADKTVPFERSQDIVRHLENGKLMPIDGAGHRYDLSLVTDGISEFLGILK